MTDATRRVDALSWLIFGGRGFVGQKIVAMLRAAGQDVLCAERRVHSLKDAASEIDRAAASFGGKVDRVVCAAGRTHTPTCSTIDGLEGAEAWEDLALANHHVPIWVAQAADPTPVLYVGTGCIYSDPHRVFTEDDAPNFFGSAYSRVKGLTDAALRHERHVITARIRMPVADEAGPRDFVSKLLSYPVICSDQPNSLTVMSSVLPALLALAHEGIHGGAFNAVNPGPLTHEEVLAAARDVAGRAHSHRLVKSAAELGLPAGRSACVLSADKLQEALAAVDPAVRALYGAGAAVPTAAEALRSALALREPRCSLLVTGGCGFIGSAFVDAWLRRFPRDRVLNVDNLQEGSGADPLHVAAARSDAPPGLSARYGLELLDLSTDCALERLLELMRAHDVTHVVHLAARTHVDESFDGQMSLEHTKTNVLGTHNLLEAARRYSAQGGALVHFLNMSTDEVYGDFSHDGGGAAEEASTVLQPTNPYAAAKAAAEMLARAYYVSHRLPCTVVRCNNCYGPRQHLTKVIPRFCDLALSSTPLTLHGGGRTLRSFVHVSDAVDALSLLLRSCEPCGAVYNIGSGQEVAIADLAQKILSLAGASPGSVVCADDRPFNDTRYVVDDARLRAFGWRPQVPFERGLAETFEWYRQRRLSGRRG